MAQPSDTADIFTGAVLDWQLLQAQGEEQQAFHGAACWSCHVSDGKGVYVGQVAAILFLGSYTCKLVARSRPR